MTKEQRYKAWNAWRRLAGWAWDHEDGIQRNKAEQYVGSKRQRQDQAKIDRCYSK